MALGIIYPDISGYWELTVLKRYRLVFLTRRIEIQCPFLSPYPETLGNPEFFWIMDYRGFSVPADENEHRIWILQVKYKFKKSLFICS